MADAASLPILFEPIFQERVWGGRRLQTLFGKALPAAHNIGESWEIVDRPEAQSVVRQGPYRGRTLHQLWRDERLEIFGDGWPETARFPLLLKLLDAREKLSLQVHPPPEIAAKLGGEPKSEMWFIVEANAGASAELFVGLRRGVTREEFARASREGQLAGLLHRIEVAAGDSIFIPSGRLHAIGAGNLIVEIQQNSDTTYRVFDWNRPGSDGKPRELHLEEAMASIDFHDFEPRLVGPEGESIVRAPEFAVDKWELHAPRVALERPWATIFCCLSGAVEMAGSKMKPGDFFLVPASAAGTFLEPVEPATTLLRIGLPIR